MKESGLEPCFSGKMVEGRVNIAYWSDASSNIMTARRAVHAHLSFTTEDV